MGEYSKISILREFSAEIQDSVTEITMFSTFTYETLTEVLNLDNFQDKVSFIWSIAELLRGPYKKEQNGDVILPLAVLRRFDCVLDSTKEDVLKKYESGFFCGN